MTSDAPGDSLIDVETREEGSVKLAIYKKYWKAIGLVLSPAILVALTLMQASKNLTDVWLAQWVSSNTTDVDYNGKYIHYALRHQINIRLFYCS